MKKILLLLLICFAQNLFAQETFTYDDFRYTINENNEITIIRYRGSLSSLDIPSVIDGKTVTTIGDEAFSDCDSLRSITIPDSVATIGEYAFNDCDSL
ncbi:MAG: leucine-rich repeat protein, partial [Treponema sp.]|nr:leucine-rich repeat protein [Treponema sp.]